MAQSNTALTMIDEEIVDMKRQAKCETDAELAKFLGRNKSTIAQWRRRKSVPRSAKLRLEFRLTS